MFPSVLEPSVPESSVLAGVEAAIDKWIASEQPADVAELERVHRKFEFARLRALGEFERAEEWRAEGFANAASALRVKCGMNQGVAHRALKVARRLRDLPLVAEAFAAGDVSRAHVEVIADAWTADRAAALAEVEAPLVDAAKVTTPKKLGEIVRRLSGAIDGDDGAGLAREHFARRQLHVSSLLDGMFALDGFGPPDDAQFLRNALKIAEGPHRAGDPRTPTQRRYDALMDLCRAGVAHFDQGPSRERPSADVAVAVDLADLETRGGQDLATELRAHRSPLPTATLRRLTCDCRISRVITDGRSEILDVGRATRTIPTALWRALVMRDGGCTTPGCDRPPEWCEVHHIQHWADGGETTLDNTELKCRYHHRHEHEGGHDPP
jgi:hypothetical protein